MSELWSHLVSWFATHGVLPVLQFLHLEKLSSDPYDIAAALLIATLQLCIIGLLFRPLESFLPAEKWEHRQLVGPDFRYTIAMLVGIFPLFSYLILTPLANFFGGPDTGPGDPSASPLALTHWVPWLRQHPWLLFACYYMVYDCVYYWMHRLQHALPWWWALHSMHHSTRQMSCWTNDRGSLIDGFLQSMVLASVGIVMGVEPDEFAWLMLTGELVQNFSHANVNLSFGRFGRRILVAPTFHRLHHMLVDPDRPKLHNCNFGQVFSIWDQLFGTALYDEPLRPTGVGDPMVDDDNRHGVIGLQWNAFKRFWGAVRRPAGWKFGEVAFGPNYEPIPVDQLDLHALGHHVRQPASHAVAPATMAPTSESAAESATIA